MSGTNASPRSSPGATLDFLAGGGEMGERIRNHPWKDTELGAPKRWCSGLRTSLRILFTTQHPMFIFWGPRQICFYNDAYRRSLGPEKHPAILGAPGRQAWGEIWPIIGPQIDQVMRGEAATWHENQLVPIIRHGALQDVFWTYSYGPIDEPAAPHGVGGVLAICTETTEQVLTERRVTAERQRFAQLFEQAPTFMALLLGPQHVFEFANREFMRFIADRPIIGRTVAEALPEAVEQGFAARLDAVYASGEAYRAAAAAYSHQAVPDGPVDIRYLDFVFQPIRDADGAVSGILVDGVDVTTRTLADAERRERDRRKDEFLAMLAHELRNPLAPIRAAAEVITRRATGDAVTQRAADVVRRQADQLTRIVDDLLDVSRISTGHIGLKRELLLVSEVIEHAVETVAPLWRAKQHHVLTAAILQPLYVVGDLARLVQSFGNVMTNAAKYTQVGGEISIRVAATDEVVRVEVSDNGAGIAPEFLPKVFDMFVQADRTLDRTQGGLGIGLSVVKKLVEMHGGQVTVRSAGLGSGSTFEIILPRAEAPEVTAEGTPTRAPRPRRILVVDDNADAATSLCELLSMDGHQTLSAFSAEEALSHAQTFAPHVVLLDIGLPTMDGYEVARRMRQSSPRDDLTIIALTGYGQADDRVRARAAGMDAHLVKPVDLAALARLLAGPTG